MTGKKKRERWEWVFARPNQTAVSGRRNAGEKSAAFLSQLRSARLHWPIRSVQPSHPVMTRSGAMEAWMREPGGWLTQGCVALRFVRSFGEDAHAPF